MKFYRITLAALAATLLLTAGCGGSSDAGYNGSSSSSSGKTSPAPSSSSSSGSAPITSSSSGGISVPPPEDNTEPEIDNEATHFYLSYDDSASTASRDLSLMALANGRLPSAGWGRAYEFLNAETIDHFAPEIVDPFVVSMGLAKVANNEIPVGLDYEGDMYALGIDISGPTLSNEARKNVVLTLLVDVSGSMSAFYASETMADIQTLLDVTKYGLTNLEATLKDGDVINVVTFATTASTLLTDWSYTPGDFTYANTIDALNYSGSTNLNAGIEMAYQVANATYDPDKANRVIMLTDAYANTGEVNPDIIANHTVINGLEGILFAGVGIGSNFNDAFLNELTDIGKSVYSAMITPEDAARIFDEDFMRFVDHAVEDIQFRIDYPQSLDQLKSAAEEISTDESEVNTVNYAYNSQQFFLELFSGGEDVDPEEMIKLTITYKNSEGEEETIVVEKTLATLMNQGSDAIYAAASIVTLAELIAGNLNCETVTASGLYEQTVPLEVFTTYKSAISSYCQLVTP